MNWKLIGIVLGVAGVGALVAGVAEGSSLDRERSRIRKFFTVSQECQITFNGGDPAIFWTKFDGFLRKMIDLAATLKITDPPGVALYVALKLFPECDQTQQTSNSFKLTLGAMSYRIGKLMEQ